MLQLVGEIKEVNTIYLIHLFTGVWFDLCSPLWNNRAMSRGEEEGKRLIKLCFISLCRSAIYCLVSLCVAKGIWTSCCHI